jgi:holo-[acyl-carrier protein] synthase
MIVGSGIDLVAVQRMASFRARHGARGLARLFTDDELAYCLRLARPDPSLAARFAAKEAFFKAIGTGQARGGSWTDVEVVREPGGRPLLRLHGAAAEHARRLVVRRVHLSLTHTDELAAAHVLLEG